MKFTNTSTSNLKYFSNVLFFDGALGAKGVIFRSLPHWQVTGFVPEGNDAIREKENIRFKRCDHRATSVQNTIFGPLKYVACEI
jgi:hypothetical protein